MAYGAKVKSAAGKTLTLTPELISIISSGRSSMPSGLNPDNTYGLNIDLPGTAAIAAASLGVICKAFLINIDLSLHRTIFDSQSYAGSFCMNNSYTFYTRNEATGVLTSWTPDVSAGNEDAVQSAYPVCFWDKRGATTFTSINIFAATCYRVYDQNVGAYIKVYSIYTQGVEKVDYAIYMKKYPTV